MRKVLPKKSSIDISIPFTKKIFLWFFKQLTLGMSLPILSARTMLKSRSFDTKKLRQKAKPECSQT